jgi:hypothetical protein
MTPLGDAACAGLAILSAGSMPAVALWPPADAEPDEVGCPFCGAAQPILGLYAHMFTRGRCRGLARSMRFLSAIRRKW